MVLSAAVVGCRAPNPAFQPADRDTGALDLSPRDEAPLSSADRAPDLSPDAAGTTVTAGLVGYWKLDEGQGTVAVDSTGNGNGTLENGPAWTAEGFPSAFPNKGALRFDGVDDLVRIAVPATAIWEFGLSSFTWSAWVYVTANVGANDMPLFNGGSSQGSHGFDIELGTDGWYVYASDDVSSNMALLAADGPLNRWVHLVGVRDSDNVRLRSYLDGQLIESKAGPPQSTSPTLGFTFGGNTVGNHMFQGMLDDVRIYNRALTDAEIAALAAGQ